MSLQGGLWSILLPVSKHRLGLLDMEMTYFFERGRYIERGTIRL